MSAEHILQNVSHLVWASGPVILTIGLAIATVATLFFVPVVFSVLHRNRSDQTPAPAAALPSHESSR